MFIILCTELYHHYHQGTGGRPCEGRTPFYRNSGYPGSFFLNLSMKFCNFKSFKGQSLRPFKSCKLFKFGTLLANYVSTFGLGSRAPDPLPSSLLMHFVLFGVSCSITSMRLAVFHVVQMFYSLFFLSPLSHRLLHSVLV